jgi:ABC-type sugar transport system permease subunit
MNGYGMKRNKGRTEAAGQYLPLFFPKTHSGVDNMNELVREKELSLAEKASKPKWVFPDYFTLRNFTEAWERANLGHSFINTAIITVGAAVLLILIGSLAAYPLARRQHEVKPVCLLLIHRDYGDSAVNRSCTVVQHGCRHGYDEYL